MNSTLFKRQKNPKSALFLTKCTILLICVLSAQLSFPSVYLENKMISDISAEVNLTSMQWGMLDSKTDRIIGQVASKRHQTVTLVLESAISTQKVHRLTIQTGVHACSNFEGKGKRTGNFHTDGGNRNGYTSFCTVCGNRNSKSAMTSGGCFFEITFPRDPAAKSLRLVNVLVDGNSVSYFCKFNISPTLSRSSSEIPVSKSATLHEPQFKFEDASNTPNEKGTKNAPPDADSPEPDTPSRTGKKAPTASDQNNDSNQDGQPVEPKPVAGNSAERIKKLQNLKELHAQGWISNEDYEKLREAK